MIKTVLIVDDSIMMRCLIAETLADAGWLVVGEASDGREAVDLYRELRPDAVTMDIVMPETDSIQALVEARLAVFFQSRQRSQHGCQVCQIGATELAAPFRTQVHHHCPLARDGADGQATAKSLTQHTQVGRYLQVRLRTPGRHPERGQHFVEEKGSMNG